MTKKVLIIEDSKTTCQLIALNFEEHMNNVELVFAHDYSEASKILRQHQSAFHAAIVDLNLPDTLIGDAVKLVNAHHIPIVVYSSTLDEEVKKAVYKPEVINYISKTSAYSTDKIRKAVEEILRRYDTTVLVVDDSKLYRDEIKKTLTSQHINVIEAENGADALKVLFSKEHDIKLVLTDYNMPEIDGLELTIAIREQFDKDQLGILIMSGVDERETINDFIKMGANDYVVKPFDKDELLTRINANLELLDLFRKVRDMANKDYMTGAYNRRYFFDVASRIVEKNRRKNQPVAVATVDIDKFKSINDTYGHDVGDIAIKEMKHVFDNHLRMSDLSARFGGEEFCILLEEISLEHTKTLFEKIRKTFEENILEYNDGSQISYTVSIGVYYGSAGDIDTMVKRSDEALYEAKEGGRNQVCIVE